MKNETLPGIKLGELIRHFALGPMFAADIHSAVVQAIFDDDIKGGDGKYRDIARETFPYQAGLKDAPQPALIFWHSRFWTWWVALGDEMRDTLKDEPFLPAYETSPELLTGRTKVG